MRRALACAVVVLAGVAHAAPFWMDSSDGVDCTSDGTACSSFAITEDATTADHHDARQDATHHISTALNGGDGTSKRGTYVTRTGTTTAYREVTFAARNRVTMHLSMHVTTAAADKDVWVLRAGSTNGCTVELNSDRTLTLRFGATAIGTAGSYVVHERVCAAPYETFFCDGNEDCPGVACQSSCASTGQGCGRARMELTQDNDTTRGVTTCRLRSFGHVLLEGETTLGSALTGARWAVVAAPGSGNVTVHFDDAVLSDSLRTGWGFVGAVVVNGDDTPLQWSRDSCGGAGPHYWCGDEYGVSPYVYNAGTGDFLAIATPNRKDGLLVADLPLVAGVSYPAVGLRVYGRATNSSGDGSSRRAIETRLYECSAGGCAAGRTYSAPAATVVTGAGNTTDRLLHTHFLTAAPSGAAWSRDIINRLGVEIGSGTSNASNRVTATLVEYFAQFPDPSPESLLRDHDVGTNDGERTAVAVGHSNTGGQFGGVCITSNPEYADRVCSQPTCCNWDQQCDSPINGCSTDNQCRTCAGRRDEFNGTAGIPCGACDVAGDCENGGSCVGDGDEDGLEEGVCSTANSECPTTTTACGGTIAGFCDVNTNIPCTTSADCAGFGSACETTATCIEACGPGGVCQGASGYAGLLFDRLTLDNEAICSLGAEGLAELNQNRFDDVLTGTAPFCVYTAGSATCLCDDAADCAGGTCTSGVCVGGDGCTHFSQCGDCVDDGDCGGVAGACIPFTCVAGIFANCNTGQQYQRCVCKGPEPDLVLLHNTGVANTINAAYCESCGEPGCALYYQSVGSGYGNAAYCIVEGQTHCLVDDSGDLCTTDTEARTASRTGPDGSPTARCAGHTRGRPNEACLGNGTGSCTAFISACFTDAECPFGQTCVGGDADDTIPRGWCEPADDTECAAGFAKAGSFCRFECGRCSNDATRRCGTSGDCTGGGTCQANPAGAHADCRAGTDTLGTCTASSPFACKGRAMCPTDRTACTSDAQCLEVTGQIKKLPYRATPRCTGGRCQFGAALARGADVPEAVQRNYYGGFTRHARALLGEIGAMQGRVDALNASDADGGPALVWITEPGSAGKGLLAFSDTKTTSEVATHLLGDPVRFPLVIDGRHLLRRNGNDLRYMLSGDAGPTDVCVNDAAYFGRSPERCVHYSNLVLQPEARSGQWQLAAGVGDFVNGFNACAQGECVGKLSGHGPPCGTSADCAGGLTCSFRGATRVRMYCKAANGVFDDTPCTSSLQCSGGRTCQPRPCTCTCTITPECRARFGAGSTCQSGQCRNGSTDSCATIYNGDSNVACNLATKRCEDSANPGLGNDACPGARDACWVEP